jgi:hypothetical protein
MNADEDKLASPKPAGDIMLDRRGRSKEGPSEFRDSDWRAPTTVTVSEGHVHDPDAPDINDEVMFEVHVQLTDRCGASYFDWVILKPFKAFWELHTSAVRVRRCMCTVLRVFAGCALNFPHSTSKFVVELITR